MHARSQTKIQDGIKWSIDYSQHGHVIIIVKNLKTKKVKICEYDCPYNFRDGYTLDDVLEINRILEDFIREVKR